MTVISIGELSNRFRLETPVRTPEAGGGAHVAWTLVAEIWGALRSTAGSESLEADGLKARTSHEIWIRYREGLGADMRFVLGARVFDIRAVIEQPERRRFLKCVVEERRG